uniref:DNA primase DnaG n=1 Tax=uncultured marine group II/III euryarchaeote KM3_139_C07 TaxID=1457870 RepID=A0A075GAX5_9EURY|nr:TOPRIM domain-containing protein [uncultured marine group II/III euryarchaeote KM3_139_C07]
MGKVSQVAAKYIIHATINIEGVVSRPDVVGAVFGQTEGLLGSDLELRELQRSGRIGRIEVDVETKLGKTEGKIDVPTSLDKTETSLVGGALEVIKRIGPCNAKVKVDSIEDVRGSQRDFVVKRAKELLKSVMDEVMPDSQEMADEVAHSVRVMEIQEYGKDRLPAGPAVVESNDVIVVEGRADVLNLLKYGIKNAIAVNGTSIPETISELSKEKSITAFVDGDRGGKLIVKELFAVADIDYVTFAPDGKEVEEITKKEIHQALQKKVAAEQAKLDLFGKKTAPRSRSIGSVKRVPARTMTRTSSSNVQERRQPSRPFYRKPRLSPEKKGAFKKLLNDLIGTRGASILNDKLEVLGKVPVSELSATIKSLGSGIHAVIFDGIIDSTIVYASDRARVKYLIAMGSKINPSETRVGILVSEDFN